ncbi:hypothetical protein CDD83_7076 [Cordyceps sp. RAO-2017]|nr:hypothetical protein CDD83_7076 [Cordyceps sp. RAO-2017]
MSISSSRPSIRLAALHLRSIARAFSTSTPIQSNIVPPESPSYIRLPDPPQSCETRRPRVRGHLPVPREIFPRLEGDRKIQPEYIQRTAPEPLSQRKPINKAQRWKFEMAANRRGNLKEGLHALWNRRSKNDKIRQARVTRKFEEHRKAAAAPEREDDRLTRTTVLEALLDTKVYPDPDRFSRADRSRTRVLAQERAKREARRDALMELYISASNFIVQESELETEINRIFRDDYFKVVAGQRKLLGATQNVWGVYGSPPSVSSMLHSTVTSSSKLTDLNEFEYDLSVNRHKRIAEDLTGGKMP